VDNARWEAFCRKRDAVSRETERLRGIWVSPKNLAESESARVLGKAIDHEYNLADLLRRPNVGYAALMSLDGGRYANPDLPVISGNLAEAVEGDARVDALAQDVFVASVIEHASRITGITPAAISLLMVHLKKGGFKEFAVAPALPATAEGQVVA
jgi:tRNA uridine 5-carboxymethylaminomethyl modification enzyme